MTSIDENDLRGAFEMFDKNGNGEIEIHELRTVMQCLGQNPTEKDIKAMIDEHDLNKDGTINFEEFGKMMKKRMKSATEVKKDLEISFKLFDRNGDGKISAKELQEVMTSFGEKLSDEEVAEMIRDVDTNQDGFVDYNEFVLLFTDISGGRK